MLNKIIKKIKIYILDEKTFFEKFSNNISLNKNCILNIYFKDYKKLCNYIINGTKHIESISFNKNEYYTGENLKDFLKQIDSTKTKEATLKISVLKTNNEYLNINFIFGDNNYFSENDIDVGVNFCYFVN